MVTRSAFLIFLVGCSTVPKTPSVVELPIPVPCLRATIPPKPDLPVSSLNQTSPPDQVVKAYAGSLEMCLGRVKALEELLK